jgi:CheY-like chemotaxis protein
MYQPKHPVSVSILENRSLTSPAQQPPPSTVLVVEDEASVRHLCARILEEEGYRVLTARDGLEALAMLEAVGGESIELVVSDLKMPRMDGLQLSANLAARRTAPPVILISGYSIDQPTGRPIIPKPFHAADLLTAVRRMLAASPKAVAH